jgi:hypothetical protein
VTMRKRLMVWEERRAAAAWRASLHHRIPVPRFDSVGVHGPMGREIDMATDEDMKTKIYALVKARDRHMTAKAALDVELAAFQDRTKPLRDELATATTEVQVLRVEITKAAITGFQKTGLKKFFGGVAVKVYRHLQYDPDKAKAWAKTNLPVLVRTIEDLDRRAFEAAVGQTKTVDGEKQLVVIDQAKDFVSVVEVPAAQVPEVIDVQVDP